MVIFDTNMVLRYLLNDNEEMNETAKRYLLTDSVGITIEVAAEAIYVLNGLYKMDRSNVADTLQEFLELVYCDKADVLSLALKVYASNNLDFVDCVLYAYNRIHNHDIATFDKKLLRLLEKGSL